MDWKIMLAYVTGSVDEELLRRNEYLVAENRILRAHTPGRVKLSDGDRRTLAEIGKRLGRAALAEIASIVRPETILAWHRRLVAKKFDGSKKRTYPSKEPRRGVPIPPRLNQDVEHIAVLVHSSPQVLLATVDRDEELVEVPCVAQAAAPQSKSSGVGPSERSTPVADGLIGDADAALGDEVFHISKAQAEPKVQPDGVSDDVRRESIAVVARRGVVHAVTLLRLTSN